jgi:hypothetical protein
MCRFFRVSSTYQADMSMARTCIENGIFLSLSWRHVQKMAISYHIPNHIEDKLDMVCQPQDHFSRLGKMVLDFTTAR